MSLSALSVMMEECGFETLIKDPKTGSSVPPPLAMVCPGSCSGNGNCDAGVCTCALGFEGEDCSIDSRQPPIVDGISG